MAFGSLFLIPTPIGNEDLSLYLPQATVDIVNSCNYYVVEELRSARRFLKKAAIRTPIDDLSFFVLNEHTDISEISAYLEPIYQGFNLGLMSEAGLPCIADPGWQLVAMAQSKHIPVIPLVGPSSLMLALMSSGFTGQSFAFSGYLPVEKSERIKTLRKLENKVCKYNQTQIFIEAPYRNDRLLQQIIEVCNPDIKLCIASEILTDHSLIETRFLWDWKQHIPNLHKRNTVFVLGK